MSSTGLWALEELLLEEKTRPSMNIRISEWMNELVSQLSHIICNAHSVGTGQTVFVYPLWVSAPRLVCVWAPKGKAGTGHVNVQRDLDWKSRSLGFYPRPATTQLCELGSSFLFLGLHIPICRMGVGRCPRTFPSYTFTFLTQNGSIALQAPESPWCSQTKLGKRK